MLEEEIWKTHPCGVKVSNFGQVFIPQSGKHHAHYTFGSENRHGYLIIKYQEKLYHVHRLVCDCFIPNLENKPQIDHKDRDKKNNKLENLRWATASENLKNREIPKNNACSKVVLQYTKTDNFVKEWQSTKEVERQLGFSHGNISNCCHGKHKTAYGYIWKYKDEDK